MTGSDELPGPRTLWRAAPPQQTLWAHWGGDYAMFHRASGLTHFVNHVTVTLLREVLVAPHSLDDAAARLAAAQSAEADPEFVAEVAALIERLEVLGLVERVPA